jgi:hypothetical protein
VVFILKRLFNVCKTINVIHHINGLKDNKHGIILINSEKAFDKVQHHLMIKTLNNLELEGMFPNKGKIIHHKLTANIILNDEKLKALSLTSGVRQICPLSPLLFNIVLQVLARAISQTKK